MKSECKFQVGDIVRLKRITEEDETHGRYKGEICYFQNLYICDVPNERDTAEVRFGDWGGYVVYLEDLEFVARANVTSIFMAHCMEDETELMADIKALIGEE